MKKTIYVVVDEQTSGSWIQGDDALYTFDRAEAVGAARDLAAEFISYGYRGREVRVDGYEIECADGATAKEAYTEWLDEQCCAEPTEWVDLVTDEDVDTVVEKVAAAMVDNGDTDPDWSMWVMDEKVRSYVPLLGNDYERALGKAKPTLESFAFKAKVVRKGLDLTQAQASEATDVPLRTVENWESGTSTPPSYVQTMYLKTLRESF